MGLLDAVQGGLATRAGEMALLLRRSSRVAAEECAGSSCGSAQAGFTVAGRGRRDMLTREAVAGLSAKRKRGGKAGAPCTPVSLSKTLPLADASRTRLLFSSFVSMIWRQLCCASPSSRTKSERISSSVR